MRRFVILLTTAGPTPEASAPPTEDGSSDLPEAETTTDGVEESSRAGALRPGDGDSRPALSRQPRKPGTDDDRQASAMLAHGTETADAWRVPTTFVRKIYSKGSAQGRWVPAPGAPAREPPGAVSVRKKRTSGRTVSSQRFAILEYARKHNFRIDDFIEATASGQASEKRRRGALLMATVGDVVSASMQLRLRSPGGATS